MLLQFPGIVFQHPTTPTTKKRNKNTYYNDKCTWIRYFLEAINVYLHRLHVIQKGRINSIAHNTMHSNRLPTETKLTKCAFDLSSHGAIGFNH